MRKLVAVEFLTVDGVMQGLGSPDEDTDGGFTHGGWGVEFGDVIHEAVADAPSGQTGAFLFGRRTYEKMAAFWPHQPDTNPMAAQLNATPKYVATQTLSEFDWHPTQRLEGELPTAVEKLKSGGDGDIVVLGSGILAASLMEQELVDEYRLFIHPLLLGTGKRLFRGLPRPQRLHLVHAGTTTRGSVALIYRTTQAEASTGED